MDASSAAQIVDELMKLAGEPPAGEALSFAGADPVLPTPFRIGDLGAAAIGAAAVQAARIFEQRTGRGQRVSIDVDAAAVAMRSSRYLTQVPPMPRQGSAPVAFYLAGDGRWIFMQRLFKHHVDRQLSVLRCAPDDASIAAAVAGWDAADLEDAITEAGACAALVRTRQEWTAHEQGRAVAALPLLRITRTGDSDPESVGDPGPLGPAQRPLSGLRVLDVTRVLAGPTCARTLAEHGADVLRVGTGALPDDPQMMRDTGHGKRSCDLDLTSAAGAGALRRLVAGADVFSQGYRPGVMESLGFGPEELARLRPGIITVSISAYGAAGPWRGRRGFDSVVQSANGTAHEVAGDGAAGDGEAVPHALPANPLDYTTGYLAAFGVLVALGRRARAGGSYHVELSLAQTGEYLSGLTRADAALVAAREPDLPAARLDELMLTRDTAFGTLRYFAPVARMLGTPPHWELPTAPLDSGRPEWV